MIVELVSTGSELLLGQIVNTNATYLSQKLNDMGYDVMYQSTVGDNKSRMTDVLQIALSRADIVITSGGLGPTLGDITKETTASLLGLEMVLHEPSVAHIRCFFERRQLQMTQNNLRQAMMPVGAIVVENRRGTAPGVILEHANKIIIHLPGPPAELEHMFENGIMPYLTQRFGGQGSIVSRVLRTFGLGESAMDERLRDHILAQKNPTIALLARSGEIHVRLTAKASSVAEAESMLDVLDRKIRDRIDEYVFGTDQVSLEQVVGELLQAYSLKIAVAESCTGGALASRITDVPGSSSYMVGGIVSYSNEVKMSILGVTAEMLTQYGAVSQATAIAMAEGVRNTLNADIGVGVTGIAGPGGGTDEKPVGLVYIAITGPHGTEVLENRFTGQRSAIKVRTVNTALDLIRRYVNRH